MDGGSLQRDNSLAGRPAGEAVAQLVERYGGKIFSLGLKLCGNRNDAEDLAQETFLLAYRKWRQFEGRSAPSSWLYSIATRACQRRHRRRVGEPARLESLDDPLPSGETLVAHLPSPEDGPFDDQLRREAAEVVDRALVKLPLRFRLPLVLKELAELSLREIAAILGIEESTVKTRVHRARMALRTELESGLARRSAPLSPAHPRQICLDLLRAKMEALDRGAPFPVPGEELCSRCDALFDSLDLTVAACRWVRGGALPESLRRTLVAAFNR